MPSAPMARDTDGQLLERFVQHGEQGAFTQLVDRHLACVLGVSRRVLRHQQDAEDILQGTFLVLARKAGQHPWQSSVRKWLSTVAYRLALHAKTTTSQRRQLQANALECHIDGCEAATTDPSATAARREIQGLLDVELQRLPEKYRAPVVLCYLEGKTNDEAARQLGWPRGSMSRRLARARSLLRQRLTQRGLALALILLCLGLASLLSFRAKVSNGNRQISAPMIVAQAMSRLNQTVEGNSTVEQMLDRLARLDHVPADIDRSHLLLLTDRTVAVADVIRNHDPGQRQSDWDTYTEQMHGSAGDLAEAARNGDQRGILAAAVKLNAACQQCHDAFRPSKTRSISSAFRSLPHAFAGVPFAASTVTVTHLGSAETASQVLPPADAPRKTPLNLADLRVTMRERVA